MFKKSGWAAGLLAALAAVALTAGRASAQGESTYNQPETRLWEPLSTSPQDGGLFIAGEYVMYRGTNPLKPQVIGVSGFTDTLGHTAGSGSFTGNFNGSASTRLDVQQVTGEVYTPGYKQDLGWKFQDGSALTLSWLYLFNTNKEAAATFAAAGFRVRNDLADSFISAPVFNFPPEFSGPLIKITDANGNGVPGGATGIWNGASIMTEQFQQKVQQWDLTYRIPVVDNPDCRISALVGGRLFWIWEGYTWTANDIDLTTGLGGGFNSAVYTNIVSNRMYGPHFGTSYEQYLGAGFAVQLDLDAAGLLDIVKERVKYAIALRDTGPEARRSRTDFTLVPEVAAGLALVWYPYQSIQVRAGYNIMAFFNTIGSQNPVDFNFGTVDPKFDRVFRMYDGLDIGISFLF